MTAAAVVLPHVLVIAYACEPDATSEPGVGWNFVREMANFARLHVITRSNNRAVIEAALPRQPAAMVDNVTWSYIEGPAWAIRAKKKLPLGIQWYYALWQRRALHEGRRLLRNHRFDFAHHLTFGVGWLSPAAARLPLPLLWGPIGGGDCISPELLAGESWRSWLNEWYYRMMARWIRHSPMRHQLSKHASVILFRTGSAEKLFPPTPHAMRRVLCETATTLQPRARAAIAGGPLRVVCVGRLLYSKGVIHALRGFHEFIKRGGEGTLTFLGSGPEMGRLREYVAKHKLGDHVLLRGKVPHAEVESLMRESDVLIHASFREGGSWTVLEAMSHGLVTVCMRISGLADMVDDESGLFVRGYSQEILRSDIGDALLRLWRNPDLRHQLGERAQARIAKEYNWDRRREQMRDVYAEMMRRV